VQRGEGGVGLLRRSRAHDALLGAPGVPAASVTARGDGTELPARGHADPRRGRGCWAALLLAAAAAVVVVAAGAAAGFLAALPVVAWALWLLLLSATRGGGAAAGGATGGSRASDQCRGRRNLDLVREAQFLEEELVASVGEGEVVGGDVVGGVGEFLVQCRAD